MMQSNQGSLQLPWKKLLFLALGLTILLFYLMSIDINSMASLALQIHLGFIGLGLLLWALSMAVDTYLWRMALHAKDLQTTSFFDLFLLHLSAHMWGLTIPGGGVVIENSIKLKVGLEQFEGPSEHKTERIISSFAYVIYVASIGSIPVLVLMIFLLINFVALPVEVSIIFLLFVVFSSIMVGIIILLLSFYPGTLLSLGRGASYVCQKLRFTRLTLFFSQRYPELITQYRHAFKAIFYQKSLLIRSLSVFWLKRGLNFLTLFCFYAAVTIIPFSIVIFVEFLGGSANLLPIPIPAMEGVTQVVTSEILFLIANNLTRQQSALASLLGRIPFYVGFTIAIGYFVFNKQAIPQDIDNVENSVPSSNTPLL